MKEASCQGFAERSAFDLETKSPVWPLGWYGYSVSERPVADILSTYFEQISIVEVKRITRRAAAKHLLSATARVGPGPRRADRELTDEVRET